MKRELLENKKISTGEFISDSVCDVLPVFLYVDNNFLDVMARIFRQ